MAGRRHPESLKQELASLVQLPGITNAWVMPIRTRIDMLLQGSRHLLGVEVAGADLDVIQRIGQQLESILADVPGTSSVCSKESLEAAILKWT